MFGMRFVSAIQVMPVGRVPYFNYSVHNSEDAFDRFCVVVTVHDTCDGSDCVIKSPIGLSSDILGFSLDVQDETGMLVRHTHKTASLHKYVAGIKRDTCEHLLGCDTKDSVMLNAGRVMMRNLTSGSREIVLSTTTEVFYLYGETGSVVTSCRWLASDPISSTLYETLSRLYHESGVNLMRYDKIQLYSSQFKCWTEISLIHNQESDRYFSKMWLDICTPRR